MGGQGRGGSSDGGSDLDASSMETPSQSSLTFPPPPPPFPSLKPSALSFRLQGNFGLGEPLSAIYEWVCESLRSPSMTYELVDPAR
jgi:hypothetical protein